MTATQRLTAAQPTLALYEPDATSTIRHAGRLLHVAGILAYRLGDAPARAWVRRHRSWLRWAIGDDRTRLAASLVESLQVWMGQLRHGKRGSVCVPLPELPKLAGEAAE